MVVRLRSNLMSLILGANAGTGHEIHPPTRSPARVAMMAGEGLGPTLKRLRSAARLTQEELAERSGISARTISDLERGLRNGVYPHTARRLAAALGLEQDAKHRFEAVAAGRTAGTPQATTGALP